MIKQIFPPLQWHKQLLIIIPVYNEEQSLPTIMGEWSMAAKECGGMVLFLHDGGKDGSLNLLIEAREKYENVIVLDKVNTGHGSTCILGYQWAIEHDFEWIFQTDSDGQTQAKDFLNIWQNRQVHQFIFGYRPHRGDGQDRMLFSKILMLVILVIFRIYVKDSNVPFRLMKASQLKNIIDKVPKGMYLSNAFLTVLVCKSFPIQWVPITFNPRIGGVESVSTKKFFKIGLKVIKEFWPYRKVLY